MTKIKLYSGTEIEQIEWASKTNGKAVQNYFTEMLLHQASYYIDNDNVTAQLMILEIDRLLLPITVSTPYKGNSYVVSPYTQYIDYAIEELRELKHPILETGLKGMLKLIGRFFYKSEIDRIVIVNNWLLSTNLYENLKEGQAKEITLFLAEKFPDCAIMFRSLTNTLHTDIISELGNIGCKFIPSRSIYLFYPHKFNTFSKRQKKKRSGVI
ncbi:hypothetical protein K6959_08915 [Bacillus aquiflavi]|uniref:hypothetical protein n=1 Tax=Bacillus aquiflavi TaxID=2672567 RepID=UPI001CA832AD|nr:hypothetical protein [Bacillus aquiflavi]UAC49866.1 hypothetical protein K6959_08915 [Bacillus aquiflavi]